MRNYKLPKICKAEYLDSIDEDMTFTYEPMYAMANGNNVGILHLPRYESITNLIKKVGK